MRPVNRGPAPQHSFSAEKDFEQYSLARLDLISAIGEYCSYCEVPLGVNLAIEHIMSKKYGGANEWDNFLLACPNCNSVKSSKTKSEYDLDEYYWPSDNNTYQIFVYTLQNRTIQSLIDDGVMDKPTGVRKEFLNQPYNKVWVLPNTNFSQNKQTLIRNTILLTGLNRYVPADASAKRSDRRVDNRTDTWDKANRLGERLAQYCQPYNQLNAIPLEINVFIQQIIEVVQAVGFWSAWLTVFIQKFQMVNVNQTLTEDLFKEIFKSSFFPGTDYFPYVDQDEMSDD